MTEVVCFEKETEERLQQPRETVLGLGPGDEGFTDNNSKNNNNVYAIQQYVPNDQAYGKISDDKYLLRNASICRISPH
jgi:hypothetical protein